MTEAFAAKLETLYGRIRQKKVEEASANEALMRLARVMVPSNFTMAARFRHDPAYACPPLPTMACARDLSGADPVHAGFVRTQLLRGQNRYLGAMREASRIIDAALA